MRIAMIYQGEYPPAERIEKISKTLIAAGHKVFLLCNNYGDRRPPDEKIDGLVVCRIKPTFRHRTVNRVLKFPLFANPLWVFQILSLVYRFRIEVIQVIDLPLAAAAWAIARAFRIPVIMDMWENYPEALKGWAKLDWKTRWFKNPTVARALELLLMPRMDHTFVVVDEQKERLVADGVDRHRISTLTNAVDVQMFSRMTPDRHTPLDDEPGTYRLVYIGFITVERGLEDIVRAVGLLRHKMPFLRFYIAGSGPYQARLQQIIREEKVADYVKLIGWIPFDDIALYLAKSDLCVIPHVNNLFINTTIPNKLFQYMFMAKPVLVSDAKPLARIVNESACGFVFQSGNASDAATAIEKAYAARADLSIGERGRNAVLEKYTWEKVSRVLDNVYRQPRDSVHSALAQLQD
jgi:glycosyltransferase involved in cell wall biosynthesis